ncbi:zf-HC2 domain-containing protein [Micrococcaceae bacterium RIT802]|nr:zf-HC2 domain-containing protein [Micrococcaceae bacterium RIT 802]
MTGIDAADGGHGDLGAYLLGGLSAGERSRFEEHLFGCASCRSELARLRDLPARLGALSAEEANQLLGGDDPAETGSAASAALPLAGGTADGGRRRPVGAWPESLIELRRRARRRAFALAAAVAVLAGAAGGAVGYVAGAPRGPAEPAPGASYALTSRHGVQARVDLDRKAWGTEVSLTAAELPTTGVLELWILDGSGQSNRVGSWMATTTGKSAITCPVPLQLPAIERVQVRSGGRSVLAEVRLPPSGAS